MQRTFMQTSPVTAVRLLYRSFFSQATKRNWLDDVISLEDILPTLKEALKKAELPVDVLEGCERRYFSQAHLHSFTCDFFDFIAFMRSNFHGVPGTPAALVCKAVVTKLHESWQLGFSPELLGVAKGQVQHLADGLSPKELGEHELACLILRPSMVPGTKVIHLGTGHIGELVSVSPDGPITWKTFTKIPQVLEEEDGFALLPLQPNIDRLPFTSSDPFPRVSKDDVWAEFRAVFPY